MPIKSILKADVKKMLSKSGQSELYAHNLYIHLANQLQRIGFFGSQKYFEKESADELTHYYKLRDFVNDMGDTLDMPAIEACSDKVTNIGDALQIFYDTEYDLYEQYLEFYEKIEKSGDCVTATFLIEFMQIQRKSVGEAGDLLQKYKQAEVGKEFIEFDEHMNEA